jgi:hypothetical protein
MKSRVATELIYTVMAQLWPQVVAPPMNNADAVFSSLLDYCKLP